MFKQDDGISVVTKRISERQEAAFEEVDEKLLGAGLGFTKELAKSQGAQLIDNIKNIDFKENTASMGEKVIGRKLYAKVRDVYTFVLGEFVQDFVSVNYPVGRLSEIQKSTVSQLQKKVSEMEKLVTEDVGEPRDRDYFLATGEKKWAVVERAVKLERAKRAARDAKRAATEKKSKKSEKPGKISGDHDDDSGDSDGATDDLPLRGITDEDKALFLEEYRDVYIAERDVYNERRRILNKINELKKLSAEEVDRYVVVNVLIDHIRSAMVTLTQRIKASVVSVTKIHNKLTATVCLDSTGEFIANPFENSNLSGICQILRDEYFTANLVSFNRDFSDVLSCPVSQTQLVANPLLASTCTDKRISEWVSVNSWKFMTMDIFFTNILLGYLPNNAFKQKCVAEMFDFLQKIESGDVETSTDGQEGVGSMPVYQHLVDFMRVQHESESYLSITAPKNQGNAPKTQQQQQQQQQQPKQQGIPFGQRRTAMYETAASTVTLHAGEVSNEKNVTVRDADTGIPHRYTATKEKCAKCYGKSTGDASVGVHQPRCYGGECPKCKLFGHKPASCMQDLKKLPK